MIYDPSYQRLMELSWRRRLNPAEEAELRAWLAAHPDAEADWETETVLSEVLNQMPNVPAASNFTARVLEAVRLDEAAAERRRKGWGTGWLRLRGWLPRTAVASLLFGVAFGSVYRLEHQAARRREIAKSVVAIAGVATLPSPDVLENFNVVRSLNQTPADEELLRILQ